MLSNCSYSALSNQPKTYKRCSALYYTAPVLDTAASILSLSFIVVLPAAIAMSSLGNASRTSKEEFAQILGTSIVSTITFGSSAIYGYDKTYKCRNK